MPISSLTSVFLVRSEHLNHEGHLFGGDLMAEIDTVAFCLLRREYGARTFVTRAAEIQFERPARLGAVIVFEAAVTRVGTTSVQVDVTGTVTAGRVSSARMTYVNLGPDGQKTALN